MGDKKPGKGKKPKSNKGKGNKKGFGSENFFEIFIYTTRSVTSVG